MKYEVRMANGEFIPHSAFEIPNFFQIHTPNPKPQILNPLTLANFKYLWLGFRGESVKLAARTPVKGRLAADFAQKLLTYAD